jgi:HlyD family secretion protein
MKKYLIPLVVIVAIAVGAWLYLSNRNVATQYDTFKIEKNDLTEVIAEVGKVVPKKEVNLSFPLSGTVSQLLVKEGEEIKKDDLLAKIDTAKIKTDLATAQASVQEAQARLDKVFSGASSADIKISETAVENASASLDSAKSSSKINIEKAQTSIESAKITILNLEKLLTDQEKKAEEDLKQSYEDAIDSLRNSITKSDTALKTIDYIQEGFFENGQQQVDSKVKNTEKEVDDAYLKLKLTVDAVLLSDTLSTDTALTETLIYLSTLADALGYIRDQLDAKPGIYPTVTEKGYVDTERTNINTAITSITSAMQTIASTKTTNEILINDIRAQLDSANSALSEAEANLSATETQWETTIVGAEGAVQLAKDELNLKKSGPRPEDIALYKAQINQAIAYVDLIQQNLKEAELRSPIDGLVTKLYVEVGEIATLTTPVLSIMALEQFELESYISELDIANLKIDDLVEIKFDAFGDVRLFVGKVKSVNPYETIIDGDVFYKVIIEFETYDVGIKSGMTADLRIKTADKANILTAPSRYIGQEGNKKFVKVLERSITGEEIIKTVEVTVGLKGLEMTEILSGLKEGEEIIPYY